MICAKFLFPWGRCWCRTFELSSKRLIQYFSHDLNQCPSHYERFSQIQVVLIQIRYVHHHFGVPKLVKRFVSLNCSAVTIWVQKKNPRSCWLSTITSSVSCIPLKWPNGSWNDSGLQSTPAHLTQIPLQLLQGFLSVLCLGDWSKVLSDHGLHHLYQVIVLTMARVW